MEQIYFNPLTAYMGGQQAAQQANQLPMQQMMALQQLQQQQAQAQQAARQQQQLQQLANAYMGGDQQAGMALASLDPNYAEQLKGFMAQPEAALPTKEERIVAAMGLKPGTPEYSAKLWELVKASGGGVNVNVSTGGQGGPATGQALDPTEFAKVQAKRAGEQLTLLDAEARDASNIASKSYEAVELLKSGKVTSGKLGDLRMGLRSFGEAIGLPVDTKADERFVEISNGLAQLQRQPGAGATSDGDRKFYIESVANINKSVPGNLMGLVAQATSAREKQQKAEQMNRWLSGGQNPLEFEAWWTKNKRPVREVAAEVAIEFGLDPKQYVAGYGAGRSQAGNAPAPVIIEAD